MPRSKRETPKDAQVLVRLTQADHDVLSAVAHLEGVTVNALVRMLVEAEVARAGADEHVRADIENRQRYRSKRGGEIAPIDRRDIQG